MSSFIFMLSFSGVFALGVLSGRFSLANFWCCYSSLVLINLAYAVIDITIQIEIWQPASRH